jgi:hypothetical protein
MALRLLTILTEEAGPIPMRLGWVGPAPFLVVWSALSPPGHFAYEKALKEGGIVLGVVPTSDKDGAA